MGNSYFFVVVVTILLMARQSQACCTGADSNVASAGTSTFRKLIADANDAAGAALTISNSATQSSAELVKITGTAGQTAFKVATGNVDLNTGTTTIGATSLTSTASINPANAAGLAIVVTNSVTQNSGELVKITGVAGQTALKVAAGNTDLNTGTTTVSTLTDGTATLTGGVVTGAGSVDVGTDGYKVSGTKVVGAQGAAVADCSAAIAANGAISATYTQAEVEALRDAIAELQTQVNSLLAKVRTHGLIAT